MFDPLTITVVGLAALAVKKRHDTSFGVMTPARQEMYNNALAHLHDVGKLEELAKEFDKQGLRIQASVLRKRAAWRKRSSQQVEQHDELFTKAMKSKNVPAILKMADAFEGMTATHKAQVLRDYAKSIPGNTPTPAREPEPSNGPSES